MTGSLQVKNGKYYAVINLTDTNGKRKQKWISTGLEIKGNKKRAEQFLRDKLKEYELQKHLVNSDILFSDYISYWLENKKNSLDENTYQSYLTIAKAHILPYFQSLNKPLVNISRDDIQQYINFKYENGRFDGKGGLSAKTVKSHIVIIKQTLKEAVKSNLILANPSEYVTIPKIKRYEPNFYTAAQINKLLSVTQDNPLYYIIYFTVYFGLRRSEVLGLKWDSVNFEANILTIKHTVVRFANTIEKDQTKNNSSYRSFPLTEETKNMLIELKKKEEANRKLFGSEYINNDYIFKRDNGKTYSPDYISRGFSKILLTNNLPHIRFHDLRHSCASLLVANGFNLKDIQEWLGHADIQTTANIYAHLDSERKKNISQTIANSFNKC